jgi:hypothetical protein
MWNTSCYILTHFVRENDVADSTSTDCTYIFSGKDVKLDYSMYHRWPKGTDNTNIDHRLTNGKKNCFTYCVYFITCVYVDIYECSFIMQKKSL